MRTKTKGLFWIQITVLILLWTALPASASKDKALEEKVALVNGTTITLGDLDREVSSVQQQLLSSGKPVNMTDAQLLEVRHQVLESLINRELVYQEALSKGINIEEAAIDEQLNSLKKRFPGENEFKSALSSKNLSEEFLRDQIRKGLAVKQLIDDLFAQKVKVTDMEIKTFYDNNPDSFKKPEQVRVRHILIKVDPQADETQRAASQTKLKDIQNRLKKGEDFESLAKEFSQCPSSTEGGDLGYFSKGQMVKPFEAAAFALKPGEVSDIVETQFGYHLIQCVDKKTKAKIAYEECKDKIHQHLKQKKIREHVDAHIEQLKGKAKVERFLKDNP